MSNVWWYDAPELNGPCTDIICLVPDLFLPYKALWYTYTGTGVFANNDVLFVSRENQNRFAWSDIALVNFWCENN